MPREICLPPLEGRPFSSSSYPRSIDDDVRGLLIEKAPPGEEEENVAAVKGKEYKVCVSRRRERKKRKNCTTFCCCNKWIDTFLELRARAHKHTTLAGVVS